MELAQLNYLLPRLTGRGMEMSPSGRRHRNPRSRRNAAGNGSPPNPTAHQGIEEDLEQVRGGRSMQAPAQAVPLATIALVGYTNAGKITLFNRLTGAESAGRRQDVRHARSHRAARRRLPSQRRVLMSDTVGFIRNLPTTLVKAFRATLEEVTEAALMLHVVDVSSPQPPITPRTSSEYWRRSAPNPLRRFWSSINSIYCPRRREPDTVCSRVLGNTTSATVPPAVAVSARTGQGFDKLVGEDRRAAAARSPIGGQFRFPPGEAPTSARVRTGDREEFHGEYSEVVAETPESVEDVWHNTWSAR